MAFNTNMLNLRETCIRYEEHEISLKTFIPKYFLSLTLLFFFNANTRQITNITVSDAI